MFMQSYDGSDSCENCLLMQAADDREADLRRSLRDSESKHKQQVARLDASLLELQRSELAHPCIYSH